MNTSLSFVVALLFCLAATGCYCADPVVLNLSPTPSTTVAELEGPTNITFNCDTYDGELTQVTTLWTYRLPSDSASSIIVNPEDHLEFVISGTTGNNSFPFPTFRNRLTIVNMTSRLDGVLLFCGGFRQGFNELASWTLRVYRPPLLSGGQLVKVAEGDKVGVDIEGAPEAYPTPSFYQWSRQGEDVMSDSRVNFSYADVLFSSVQRMDSGVYTLTATNHRLDNETAAIGTGLGNFTLDVLYGPDITAEGVGYSVPEGGEVTLVCGRGLSSNPPAEISWFNPSGSLVSRSTVRSEEEVVSLPLSSARANDSGVWRCELRVRDPDVVVFSGGMLVARTNTEIGSRNIPVYLTVVVPPSEPLLVEARQEDIHPTNITLSWREPLFPGQPGVAAYQITAVDSTNPPIVYMSPNNNTAQTVAGLLPGTLYSITVRAVASSGDVSVLSGPSLTVNATTAVTVPAVVCDSASSGRGVITVAWSLPHTGGLPLTSLNVTYYREGRGPVVKTVDLDSIMLLLEDLVTGFNYSLTIRAGNAVGESYDRCPSVTHLIGVPRAPKLPEVESVSSEAVEIRLETPSPGVAPNQSFYYDVEYDVVPDGPTNTVSFEVVGGGVATETISELVQNSLYVFRVRARNRYGESSFVNSEVVNITGTPSTDRPTSITPNISAAVGGAVGGVLALILIILFVVVIVVCVLRFREGGSYEVHNKKARNLYLSPSALTHTDSTAGVKVEEVPLDVGEEIEAPKELHYADLDTFRPPSATQKPSSPSSPENRVQYATIDSFRSAPEPTTPTTDNVHSSSAIV